jgi:magnesium transporter
MNWQNETEDLMASHPRRYMMDVLDHTMETTQQLTLIQHDLDASAQHYLARISIEMAAASNNMAYQMKQLSIVATILLPLSLIAGLWGMNVHVPGQDDDDLTVFFTIVGCMVAFALTCSYKFGLFSGKSKRN